MVMHGASSPASRTQLSFDQTAAVEPIGVGLCSKRATPASRVASCFMVPTIRLQRQPDELQTYMLLFHDSFLLFARITTSSRALDTAPMASRIPRSRDLLVKKPLTQAVHGRSER